MDNRFWLFILFLVFVGVMWYAQKGADLTEPLKEPADRGSIITQRPAPPSPRPQPPKEAGQEPKEPERDPNLSQYEGKIILRATQAREQDPLKEYLEITALASLEAPVTITGWTLVGKENLDIAVGEGATFVLSAQTNPTGAVRIGPGEKAYVITGKSPIGTSFKINKCAGYLQQFRSFKPSLSLICPAPKDEPGAANLPDVCLDYLENLRRCQAPISIPGPVASAGCRDYVEDNINYNGCVKNHKDDDDFYGKEWRIYLGRDAELWQSRRETITLRDNEGKIVDRVSY